MGGAGAKSLTEVIGNAAPAAFPVTLGGDLTPAPSKTHPGRHSGGVSQRTSCGGTDSGYADWDAAAAEAYAVTYDGSKADENCAARMLQVIAAVQDFDEACRLDRDTEAPTGADFLLRFTNSHEFQKCREWWSCISPENAMKIRKRERSRPGSRQRSAAGLLRQAKRNEEHKIKKQKTSHTASLSRHA